MLVDKVPRRLLGYATRVNTAIERPCFNGAFKGVRTTALLTGRIWAVRHLPPRGDQSCGGTVPSTYWAYDTDGTASTSIVLSIDGSQIALVQTESGVATLVILAWQASMTKLPAHPRFFPTRAVHHIAIVQLPV